MAKRKSEDQLSPSYLRRLKAGEAKGYTRSQAAGKAQKGEASVNLTKRIGSRGKGLLTQIRAIKHKGTQELAIRLLIEADREGYIKAAAGRPATALDKLLFLLRQSKDARRFIRANKDVTIEVLKDALENIGGSGRAFGKQNMYGPWVDISELVDEGEYDHAEFE